MSRGLTCSFKLRDFESLSVIRFIANKVFYPLKFVIVTFHCTTLVAVRLRRTGDWGTRAVVTANSGTDEVREQE